MKGFVSTIDIRRQLLSGLSRLSTNPDNSKRPFGKVRVCIGLKGVPDDVQVVSISELARQNTWTESRAINERQKGGCLLFDEKTFSLLIDRLIEGIRSGQLRLPISREKIAEIAASHNLNSEALVQQ